MTNIVIFLLFLLSFATSGEKLFWIKGKIRYVSLEGGFFGIIDEKGNRYYPLNLPEEFKKDGLRVSIKARPVRDVMTAVMWGSPIEVLEIKRIEATKITVIFDNSSQKEDLEKGWGLSILIETTSEKILFDTGCDADALIQNLKTIGIQPEEISKVVISHSHWDHTGGLFALVNRNPALKIYVGGSFSSRFVEELQRKGAKVEKGEDWRKISPHIYITPELKEPVPEQALILEGKDRLLLVTGCSHPGIQKFVLLATEKLRKNLWIIGGFHLFNSSGKKIHSVAEALFRAGVKKAFPLHCSGEKAREIFAGYFEVEKGGKGFSFYFE